MLGIFEGGLRDMFENIWEGLLNVFGPIGAMFGRFGSYWGGVIHANKSNNQNKINIWLYIP